MTQGSRIKLLRKELGLSQEAFGSKIGSTRDAIAAYERGVTIKEPIIKLICRTFNVDYFWLTEGIGKMFAEIKKDSLSGISFNGDYESVIKDIYINILDEYSRDRLYDIIVGFSLGIDSDKTLEILNKHQSMDNDPMERENRYFDDLIMDLFKKCSKQTKIFILGVLAADKSLNDENCDRLLEYINHEI